MTMQPEPRDIAAVEIAKLEGEMKAGFAALEGKIDTLIARMDDQQRAASQDRTEADRLHLDYETRLRMLEARKTVSPLGLWTTVTSGVLLAIGVATFIVNLIS